jgi:L-threonylcarbamoyladenylate synthase
VQRAGEGATIGGMSPPPELSAPSLPSADELVRAAEVLRRGGLVAFPTETVYGLGADATNAAAVRRIYEVKGRPAGHPLIVHVRRHADLGRWADHIPVSAHLLADAFWPGPLTMILRRSARVPDVVTGGRDTVGLRVPDHPVARALLDAFGDGEGIAAPSANRFGRVSPTTAAHVRADLGDDIDLLLDGGACPVGVESTIIDLTLDTPEVVRPGGVSIERIAEVIGFIPDLWTGDTPARAPGMLTTHYAPSANIEVVMADRVPARAEHHLERGAVVGVLAPSAVTDLPADVIELEPMGPVDHYAHALYDRLRQADRLHLDVLLVVPPSEQGVGRAVVDRLRRAAASAASAPASVLPASDLT